ncbi:MAG: hypothetical protein M3P08_04250 [Thermoproteota archaeon]|nr:hypothetical protein [Thermoproteota archaeon]
MKIAYISRPNQILGAFKTNFPSSSSSLNSSASDHSSETINSNSRDDGTVSHNNHKLRNGQSANTGGTLGQLHELPNNNGEKNDRTSGNHNTK